MIAKIDSAERELVDILPFNTVFSAQPDEDEDTEEIAADEDVLDEDDEDFDAEDEDIDYEDVEEDEEETDEL